MGEKDVMTDPLSEIGKLRRELNAALEKRDALYRSSLEESEKAKRRFSEVSSDRDRWKARAERAEKVGPSEELLKELNSYRALSSNLQRRESAIEKELYETQTKLVVSVDVVKGLDRLAESFKASVANTLYAMELSRNKANIERTLAVQELAASREELQKVTADLEMAKKELREGALTKAKAVGA